MGAKTTFSDMESVCHLECLGDIFVLIVTT